MDKASSQVSDLSRPNAKSIYLQRKKYAASVGKMMDKFQYRVEHLITCELDGTELRDVADCVERLKLLGEMGRVWGQSMLLEVCGPKLLLVDIETKAELESVALSDILELKAVLDSGEFNSLLSMSLQPKRKRTTTVFIFQCDDVRADCVQRALSRVLSHSNGDLRSSDEEFISGHQEMKQRNNVKSSESKEQKLLWMPPDYDEDDISEPELFVPEEEEGEPSLQSFSYEDEMYPHSPYTELDRDIDILNHILRDTEIFMGHISAAVAKNAKKKKSKKLKVKDGMPSTAEFAECLHKIKCGFNILAELNGKINNPSAPEFVHTLFATLLFLVPHCPDDLPPTIVAPLLTPQCIHLMSEEATAEEDQLWQSLGKAWNIPSNEWQEDEEDLPTYKLEFFDGWQPPEVFAAPEPRQPVNRLEGLRPVSSQNSPKWRPPHAKTESRSGESNPQYMCVKNDFNSRNNRELTVRKGEIVELLDSSKQWWKVRDSRGEEGFVPNNVLEPHDEQLAQEISGSVVLTKKSKPAEVKAWLKDKGFSKITVRCLGVLSGSMLLGMTREELKTVCPEEGGRVFFQLQAVRSTMAAAS